MKQILNLILLSIFCALPLTAFAQSGAGFEIGPLVVSPENFVPGGVVSLSASVVSHANTEAGLVWYKVYRDQAMPDNFLGGGMELLPPLKGGERRVVRFRTTFLIPAMRYEEIQIVIGAWAKPNDVYEKVFRFYASLGCKSTKFPCFYTEQNEPFPPDWLKNIVRYFINPCLISPLKGCVIPIPPFPPKCPFCPPVCTICTTTWRFHGLPPETQIRFLDSRKKELAKSKWADNAVQIELKPGQIGNIGFLAVTLKGSPKNFRPLSEIKIYSNGAFVTSSSDSR